MLRICLFLVILLHVGHCYTSEDSLIRERDKLIKEHKYAERTLENFNKQHPGLPRVMQTKK